MVADSEIKTIERVNEQLQTLMNQERDELQQHIDNITDNKIREIQRDMKEQIKQELFEEISETIQERID